ncbi:hypothetical protein Forpe1208_v015629 [Fusarium oxysporum f. sp. rapae]|uniref:Transcription factor domain-containing protein n=1 Tax=Fusarium oxysporum f. sp. rapae TaxID=485398 RepID=A0A8J5NKZ2_FUSOX|nr:hypothetical protein Forpe1208_v015629 [Fusarium oxysporum f. sp. rapae]
MTDDLASTSHVFSHDNLGTLPAPTTDPLRESQVSLNTNTLESTTDPGLLPSLYTDNPDAFQFDQIFNGDSNQDLDRFFADIFSLPTFPRSESIDLPPWPALDLAPPSSTPQEYRSDSDVLDAYYRLIHPVFPILPPPIDRSIALTSQADAVYNPSSPLILSLLSILFAVQQPGSNAGFSPGHPRLTLANSFAQRATEACEFLSEGQSAKFPFSVLSPVHPRVPTELETPLAFCVLSLFQYLYCGNIEEMTRFAERAVDSAIRLSLHRQPCKGGDFLAEAKSRAWWMTYLTMCHASNVSCKPPSRPINVADVQTPFPTSSYRPKVWDNYIRAEETLTAATLLLVALVKGFRSEAAIPSFRQGLDTLNKLILSQLIQLGQTKFVDQASNDIPEFRLADCLHTITRMRLLSAYIKTHRYRALMEHPTILEKFKTFSPLDVTDCPPEGCNASGSNALNRVDQIFPFPSLESLQVCFDSCVGISDCLDLLKDDLPIAPFACSAIIAGYTALMILHFQSSGRGRTWPSLQADNLQGSCRAVVASALRGLENYSGGFPSVRTLADNLRKAATACNVLSRLDRVIICKASCVGAVYMLERFLYSSPQEAPLYS